MIVAFFDVITCTLCFFIGTDRPTLIYLNKYVIPHICVLWYDIGVQLLDMDDLSIFEVIRANNSNDVIRCATEMLKHWVKTRVDASWNTLIRALRYIGQSFLASKIENMLVEGGDISFKGMITIMCNALNFMKISVK